MVKISKVVFFSLLLLLCALILSNSILLYQNYARNIVTRVVDGDSLELADGRRIRLLGIDAPEKGNCLYEEAKQLLEKNALGKHIRLKNNIPDAYGRILANVIVEDFPTWISYLRWRFFTGKKNSPYPSPDPYLNRLMVSKGAAWNTDSAAKEYLRQIKAAEQYAKGEGLGIWSNSCIQIEPLNEECDIKGNIRHEVKTYYSPDCRYFQQVIVNTAYGDRWFCTEEEATKAGFQEAEGCK